MGYSISAPPATGTNKPPRTKDLGEANKESWRLSVSPCNHRGSGVEQRRNTEYLPPHGRGI